MSNKIICDLQDQIYNCEDWAETCKTCGNSLIADGFLEAAKVLKEAKSEIEILQRWKSEMWEVWSPVDEYARKHPSAKLGMKISDIAVNLMKKADEYGKAINESKKQKPYAVAFYDGESDKFFKEATYSSIAVATQKNWEIINLYREPVVSQKITCDKPAVAVPDRLPEPKMDTDQEVALSVMYARGWNKCIDAMLAAPPSHSQQIAKCSAFIEEVREARRLWMDMYPPEEGHDCVTPFDQFLYTDRCLSYDNKKIACQHEWVSAKNNYVKSGEICTKCFALRAEPGVVDQSENNDS